jgi:hypothetical protein
MNFASPFCGPIMAEKSPGDTGADMRRIKKRRLLAEAAFINVTCKEEIALSLAGLAATYSPRA